MAPRSYPFQGYRWRSTIMVCIYLLSFSSIASQEIIITIEPPDEETKISANLGLKGTEYFEGYTKKRYPEIKTRFGGVWGASYYNVETETANWYGGARGKGFYPFTTPTDPYRLVITDTAYAEGKDPNYFGLWVSAMNKADHLDFFHKKKPIFKTSLELIHNKIPSGGDNDKYWRNRHFPENTTAHAFVFINFYFGTDYDEIHFSSPKDRFCSDNHSVGRWESTPGHRVYTGKLGEPVKPSTPEGEVVRPEPSLPEPPRPEPPRAEPTLPRTKPKPITPKAITPAKLDLTPILSTVWITVGVILGVAALV